MCWQKFEKFVFSYRKYANSFLAKVNPISTKGGHCAPPPPAHRYTTWIISRTPCICGKDLKLLDTLNDEFSTHKFVFQPALPTLACHSNAQSWRVMARNASHFAANWPTSRSNELRQKIKKKKKWHRPTHGFLHLNLKSLVRQAHKRSCISCCLFVQVFSREISPGHFMTKNSQTRTHRLFFRQCSNISQTIQWNAAPLRAEMQPISDRRRLCQLRRKKVTTHYPKTSFHLHTVAYDHARTVVIRKDIVTSNSVDLLTVLWLRDSWRLWMYTSIFKPTEHAW